MKDETVTDTATEAAPEPRNLATRIAGVIMDLEEMKASYSGHALDHAIGELSSIMDDMQEPEPVKEEDDLGKIEGKIKPRQSNVTGAGGVVGDAKSVVAGGGSGTVKQS